MHAAKHGPCRERESNLNEALTHYFQAVYTPSTGLGELSAVEDLLRDRNALPHGCDGEFQDEAGSSRLGCVLRAPSRNPPSHPPVFASMHCPPTEVLATSPPPPLSWEELTPLATCAAVLLIAALFKLLRDALEFSHPVRVTETMPQGPARARLEALLENVQPLTTSAALFALASEVLFVISLFQVAEQNLESQNARVGFTLLLAVLSLFLFCGVVPSVFARRYGDGFLRKFLPVFRVIQLPVAVFAPVLNVVQRSMRRLVGLPEDPTPTRSIVEDLREVIVDTAKTGGLDENERELIENVMEFRDVDVAAVMTPRTEIAGVDVEKGLSSVVKKAAQSGHSRIPVYEESIDNIIGAISVRDLVKYAAEGTLDKIDLRESMRPAYFVPETMPVSQLFAEFRRERLKLAIVLDEYGGTAGLVTLGDVMEELVGELHEEFEEEEENPVRRLSERVAEVDASLHVSEVNEELDLDLPEEEDFETLAGFVLAEFGRMPRQGDHFDRDGVKFSITEASDRRVLTVRVEGSLKKPA